MRTEYKTDILVIGAGPVGLFAVFQLGMLKMQCHVVDALDFVGGQCAALYPEKPIYDIPAHPRIDGGDLVENLRLQAEPFEPVYHLGQQVVSLHRNDDGFELITSKNVHIQAKAVVLAAGCGAFGPNRPPLENIETYENKSVFYSVYRKDLARDKNVVIAGGGDSAVDWAVELANIAKSVTLVHRREKFKAAPASLDKLALLSEAGKIKLMTSYQLHSLNGHDGALTSINVADLDDNIVELDADILLPFFGLSMELGAISDWGFDMERKSIAVCQATQETNIESVFAIGDVCHYPGKLKLILTGFSEAAVAAHAAYHIIYPNQALHFEYSTTKGVISDA